MKKRVFVASTLALAAVLIVGLLLASSLTLEAGTMAGRKIYKNGFDVNTAGDCGAWDEGSGTAPTSCGTAELDNSEWLRLDIDFTTWAYIEYRADTYVEVISESSCPGCYYIAAMRRAGTSTWDYCYAYAINPLDTIFKCSWIVPAEGLNYDKLQIQGFEGIYPGALDPWHYHLTEATQRPPPPTSTPRPLP